MTVSSDLLALLAMDSYNRGLAPAVIGVSDKIGAATFQYASPLSTKDPQFKSGFSAAIYKLSDGTTVISYRGADNAGLGAAFNGGSDVINGWAAATGAITEQINFAYEFYKEVASTAGGDIVLTGHSLGGGLAEAVSLLTGSRAGGTWRSCLLCA